MFKFKPGQQVRYMGYKNNLYGDTNIGEAEGVLVPGAIYTLINFVRGTDYVTLRIRDNADWTLHTECLAPIGKGKKLNLPSWF